jgi:hypothetical protein
MPEQLLAWLVWVASLAATFWLPWAYWLIAATTLNLIHQRYTDWFAGRELQRRVRDHLAADIDRWTAQLEAMAGDLADVKEVQAKMIGTLRGRNLPL